MCPTAALVLMDSPNRQLHFTITHLLGFWWSQKACQSDLHRLESILVKRRCDKLLPCCLDCTPLSSTTRHPIAQRFLSPFLFPFLPFLFNGVVFVSQAMPRCLACSGCILTTSAKYSLRFLHVALPLSFWVSEWPLQFYHIHFDV